RDSKIVGSDELRGLMSGICFCLLDQNAAVQIAAGEALQKLFNPDVVQTWTKIPCDDSIVKNEDQLITSIMLFWVVSSQVIVCICKQILEIRFDVNDSSASSQIFFTKFLTRSLRDLLETRNIFLRRRSLEINLNCVEIIPERVNASIMMEKTFFVLLCSSDVEISTIAGDCFGYLFEETEISGEIERVIERVIEIPKTPSTPNDFSNDNLSSRHTKSISTITSSSPSKVNNQESFILENFKMYRELGLFFEEMKDGLTLGQKAFPKKIRKILKLAENSTFGIVGAWEEIYKRWRGYSQLLTTRTGSTTSTVESFKSGPGLFLLIEDEEIIQDDKKFENSGDAKGGNSEKRFSERKKFGRMGSTRMGSMTMSNFEITKESMNVTSPLNAEFMGDIGEWSNYTGFLCVMAGVILQMMSKFENVESTNDSSQGNVPQSYFEINSSSPSQRRSSIIPYQHSFTKQNLEETRRFVDNFVNELIELLVCENVIVREAVNMFLGQELSGPLYG
ncbi:Neurofibromin 1, partial [Nowakowskiella sp. JEL0078]